MTDDARLADLLTRALFIDFATLYAPRQETPDDHHERPYEQRSDTTQAKD
jgi:hypothetical protein